MKISSASKKVLASALSAAMVVAFAPTVAFGEAAAEPTAVATVTYSLENTATGKKSTSEAVEFYSIDKAIAAANKAKAASGGLEQFLVNGSLVAENAKGDEKVTVGTGATAVTSFEKVTGATVKLLADATGEGIATVGVANMAEANAITPVVTIDLNGHVLANKVTGTLGSSETDVASAAVTVKGSGSIVDGSYASVKVADGAEVALKSVVATAVDVYGTVAVQNAAIADDASTLANETRLANAVSGMTVRDGAKATTDGGAYGQISFANVPNVTAANAARTGELVVKAGVYDNYYDSSSTMVKDVADDIANMKAFYLEENKVAEAAMTKTAGDGSSQAATYTVAAILATYIDDDGNDATAASVSAALDAAKAGTTVKLAADITNEPISATINSGVKLDLAGHTIKGGSIGSALTLAGTGVLTGVDVNESLTIAKDADITLDSYDTTASDGTVTHHYTDLDASSKSLTVEGKLTAKGVKATSVTNPFGVTVKAGGTFNAAKGKFAALSVEINGAATIDGAEVTTLNVNYNSTLKKGGALSFVSGKCTTNPATVVSGKSAVAAGSVSNLYAANSYEVGAPVATATTAEYANDGVTKYETDTKCASVAGAAYVASQSTLAGATVALTADAEGTFDIDGNMLVLDLAGHTLTGTVTNKVGTSEKPAVIKGGTVTAKARTLGAPGNGSNTVVNSNAKYLVIEDATITRASETGFVADAKKMDTASTINNAGTLTIKSGTVTNAEAVSTAKSAIIIDNASTGAVSVKGGTVKGGSYAFKNAATAGKIAISSGSVLGYKTAIVSGNKAALTGGTFSTEPKTADGLSGEYVATKNADGTYTVGIGINIEFTTAVDGTVTAAKEGTGSNATIKVVNADKVLDAAATKALNEIYAAAQSANPASTELAGFEFATGMKVESLTKHTGTLGVSLVYSEVDSKDVTLSADEDYVMDKVFTVKLAVTDTNDGTIGYLTGVGITFTYAFNQQATNTYKVLGVESASYDAENKLYTIKSATSAQFAAEAVSNSILELREQMKQIEIAAQDKEAANTIKGTAKTIKTKKGVTAKKYTVKVKAVTSESGAKATYKKANTAGKSKITVAKSGTITIKKGLKKGTYKVKVKGTVGASSKTVTAKIVIK